MTKESAVANISSFRPRRAGLSSNLIQVDFINKTRLPENVIQLPEPAVKLTVVTPEQRLAQIIEFPQLKTEASILSPKSEPDLIEKTKKEQAYRPGKNKSYMDALGRWVIRRRGRSGCRCDGDERSAGCRSRSCRNKDKQVKPIDIRARVNGRINTRSQPAVPRAHVNQTSESRKAS